MKKKKKGCGGCLAALIIVLLLLFVVVVFAGVYAGYLMNLIGRYDESEETVYSPEEAASMTEQTETVDENYTGEILSPDDITLPTVQTVPEEVEQAESSIVNILLIGQDRRAGQGRQRSDTMILVTFNKANNSITLTSFLRDLYVQIPGYKDNRLNVPYVYGGMPLLKLTMLVNFGITVDACVEVDFNGFVSVIDLIGGVDITLTEAEARYLVDGCKYDVVPGLNHLTGAQALDYARLREIDNDFNRTQRQRNVLLAVYEKCKGMSLVEMNGLLTQVLPMITTDMTNSEMVSYLMELFPVVAAGNISTLRIPANGTYKNALVDKKAVLVADLEANRQILYEMLLGED